MKRRYLLAIVLIVVIIVAMAVVLTFESLGTPSLPVIVIEPESVSKLGVNGTFTLNVSVKNCVDVYAVQVDIRYDPRVINVTGIFEGTFLNSTGSTTVLYHETAEVTNSTPPRNTIYFVATKMGDQSSHDSSGNGTLLTIAFQVISNGSTQLQFFPYVANTSTQEGTYFMKRDHTEVIPQLRDGFYGS
jgi:hypothetical protein